MKYRVFQSFETLGHADARTFPDFHAAEEYANVLREDIACMVASWPTPESRPKPLGLVLESDAWDDAARIAGVQFDEETGERIAGPEIYGRLAGHFIANIAVRMEEVE